jgi:RNA polymerase sigma factor (sigma-70 family)
MSLADHETDETLLARARHDESAFATFYARYERPVTAFFVRAVGRGDLAIDLTAETFAAALGAVGRFDANLGTGSAWLFGIARHLLARSRERGRVEDQARRRLGMPPLSVDDELIERVMATAGDGLALELLAGLPDDQRHAVRARVVDELEYAAIAQQLRCSESVVRKRVSRGLATLRARLSEGDRR